MKRLLALVLILLLGASVCAEQMDLSSLSPQELRDLISAAREQLSKSEPVIVEQAIEQLKTTWLEEVYSKSIHPDADGYLEILHTQVTYIREEVASQQGGDSREGELFHDVYCVVDFVLLSDFYGTGPYRMSAGIYDSVVVYRDGTVSAAGKSPFIMYFNRTYNSDFSGIIESVHDCGGDYNAVFHLLEK